MSSTYYRIGGSIGGGGGGGGGGGTIGQPVIGGTPGSVLFIDASGNLGQDTINFEYLPATHALLLNNLLPGSGATNINALGPNGTITRFSTESLTLDGISRYLEVADAANLRPSATLSISFWVKGTAPSSEAVIISKADYGTNQRSWFLDVSPMNGNITGLFSGNGSTNNVTVGTTSSPLDGTWHHICFTNGATYARVYVDSVKETEVAAESSFFNTTGIDLLIGAIFHNGSPNLFWPGEIDEVAISTTTEWSQAQVTTLYNNGYPADLTSFPGVTSWWRMGESPDSATTVIDRTGTNNATGHNLVSGDFTTDTPPPPTTGNSTLTLNGNLLMADQGTFRTRIIFYGTDDDLGSILWNTDGGGDIGLPTGQRPENLYLSQNVTAQLALRLGYLTSDALPTPGAGSIQAKSTLALLANAFTMNATLDMGSNKITSVTDPTSAQDAATKHYVDTHSATYTFADSLVNSSGTVTLVNDSGSPANDAVYSTNSAGTLGYHAAVGVFTYATSSQTIVTGAATKITIMQNQSFDTDSGWSNTNNQYTVPSGKGGIYLISAAVALNNPVAAAEYQAVLFINGSQYSVAACVNPGGGNIASASFSIPYKFTGSGSETVALYYYASSGFGSTTIFADSNKETYLSIVKVGH